MAQTQKYLLIHLRIILSKLNIQIRKFFKLYARAFNGANQGLLVFQEHTESYSPFTDVDFLSYCYSIPVELRHRHKVYFDWIFEKYPKATEYQWEKIRGFIKPINAFKTVNILGRKIEKDKVLLWLYGAFKRRMPLKLNFEKKKLITSDSMNPFDYWYQNNNTLKEFMDSYYLNNINIILDKKMQKNCEHLFYSSNVGVKTYVLTLLSALKMIT